MTPPQLHGQRALLALGKSACCLIGRSLKIRKPNEAVGTRAEEIEAVSGHKQLPLVSAGSSTTRLSVAESPLM
jgi:hypothetical protein